MQKYFKTSGICLLWTLWSCFALFLPQVSLSLDFEKDFEKGLESVLTRLYRTHAESQSVQLGYQAEKSMVDSYLYLPNPKFSVMQDSTFDSMSGTYPKMWSWGVSQELPIPFKVWAQKKAQKYRAEQSKWEGYSKNWEIRTRFLNLIYSSYSNRKMLTFLEADKETLKQMSRVAEVRKSTGSAPQQDEMKAHMEQTRIENEILMQSQELFEQELSLKKILELGQIDQINIVEIEKDIEKRDQLEFKSDQFNDSLVESSPEFLKAQAKLGESQASKLQAQLEWIPDLMLSYKKGIGSNQSNQSLGLELSLPLWFWSKSAMVSTAQFNLSKSYKENDLLRANVKSESKMLSHKIETLLKVIKIYSSTLIPQTQSTFNASLKAYSAGKTGFQDLLDSQRSMYSAQSMYYQTLIKAVASVAELEQTLGKSLSNLPIGDLQ